MILYTTKAKLRQSYKNKIYYGTDTHTHTRYWRFIFTLYNTINNQNLANKKTYFQLLNTLPTTISPGATLKWQKNRFSCSSDRSSHPSPPAWSQWNQQVMEKMMTWLQNIISVIKCSNMREVSKMEPRYLYSCTSLPLDAADSWCGVSHVQWPI